MGNRLSYVKKTQTTKHPDKTDVAESAFYQYNDSNQLVSAKLFDGKKSTTVTYTYDATGSLISETGEYGTDKVETYYDYTVENRLQAVYDGDRLLMAAAYDGDGNRVFQLNYNLHTDEDRKDNSGNGNGNNKDNAGSGNNGNGNKDNGNNKENSKSDGTDDAGYGNATNKEKDYELIEYILDINTQYTQVLMELNENGAMDVAYTYGTARLTEDRFTGESNFYLYDPSGNVAGITDQNGYLWQSYRYDAFGNATFGSPQYDNEYTFNAESYNPNIHSQYLRARYYDTVKGCFLTEDTYLGDIRNPLTLNRYSYCIGNPLFYSDPSGHDLKSFTQRVLFGDPKLAGTVKQKISEGDKWAKEVIREHENKKNKFMDDTYDWVGDHFPIKNNTTYGQIHNNFTAGVAGSVYNTVDMVTSPEYLGAKAYSVAAHPKQILAAANMSGRDAARGLQGVAGKIKNKEYGPLARSAGYVTGSAAQAYALGKGIEKCGDLINKKKYGTGTYADGMPLEDATASIGDGTYSGEEWYNYFVDTYGKENVQGTFFNEIKYEPTSGVNFTSTKGKTTTILGRYDMDTQYIFEETGNIKSLSYDGHEGGFNLLNVPDDLSNVSGGDFWNDYNVPFLDKAIGRNDVFSLATEPNQASMYRINRNTGLLELSGFGKEIKYLESKGYVLDKDLMQMVSCQ